MKGTRYTLSRLYELQGNIEKALDWAKQSIQQLLDPRIYVNLRANRSDPVWHYLSTCLHEGRIPPERLIRWCEDVLRIPGLHPSYRLHTQYLLVDIYNFMNDNAKVEAMLASLGAPRESDWMVIGPFDASGEDLFPESPPFALLTNLAEPRMGILDKEIQWQSWEDDESLSDVLTICQVFNKKYYGSSGLYSDADLIIDSEDNVKFDIPSVVYSCIYVEVPKAMEAQVRTGSGLMNIWLNENPAPVIKVNSVLTPIPDDEVNNVSLKAGLNRFLVATVSGAYAFNFSFRITDRDGNPISGLKYVSAKEVLASH